MINITHKFVSPKSEQTDPTIVGPNEWNAVHATTDSSGIFFTQDFNLNIKGAVIQFYSPLDNLSPSLRSVNFIIGVPLGVNGSDSAHYLAIYNNSGVLQETVLINGGSAVSGGNSGNVTFASISGTYAAGSYKIGSATAGIQEATIYAAAQAISNVRPGGATVWLYWGISNIYAAVTIPASITFRGFGMGNSIISMQTNGQNGIVVPSTFTSFSIAIQDFIIRYQDGITYPTSGSAIQLNTPIVGLIANVAIDSCWIGIEMNGVSQGPFISNCQVQFKGGGIGIYSHGNTPINPGGLSIDNVNIEASGAGGQAILYQGTSAGTLISNAVLAATQGLVFISGAGNALNEIHLTNIQSDPGAFASGVGLSITGDASTPSNTIHISNSKFSCTGTSSVGVAIQSTDNDAILLSNNWIAGVIGLVLAGTSNVQLDGNNITGPTAIQIQNSTTACKFTGNRIGFAAGGFLVGATSNIVTDNTPTAITFSDNDFYPSGTIIAISGWSGTANYIAPGQPGVGIPTVASASSITIGPYPLIIVTGTTPIATIVGGIEGQIVKFIFTNASPGGVTTGGNILRAQSAVQNQSLTLTLHSTNWY